MNTPDDIPVLIEGTPTERVWQRAHARYEVELVRWLDRQDWDRPEPEDPLPYHVWVSLCEERTVQFAHDGRPSVEAVAVVIFGSANNDAVSEEYVLAETVTGLDGRAEIMAPSDEAMRDAIARATEAVRAARARQEAV